MDKSAIKVFRLVAAEFKGVSDRAVKQWMDLTAPLVSRKRFGKLYEQALALLTAHRMKMAGFGSQQEEDPLADIANVSVGGLMRVGSYSEGETSISFNSNMTGYTDLNAELALTPYGIQYLSLLRMKIMSITSAGESNGRA